MIYVQPRHRFSRVKEKDYRTYIIIIHIVIVFFKVLFRTMYYSRSGRGCSNVG